MSGGYPFCSLCTSERASRACLCSLELKLICNNCLSSHLSRKASSHHFIDISLALQILSGRVNIESFLTQSLKSYKSDHSKSRFIYVAKPQDFYISKYDVLSHNYQKIYPYDEVRNYKVMTLCEANGNDVFLCTRPDSIQLHLKQKGSRRCIKLADFLLNRENISIFYHSNYIYLLSTVSPNYTLCLVDRLNLTTNRWESLPTLRKYDENLSPIFIQDLIYFFPVSDTSIQVIDTTSFKLNLLTLTYLDKNKRSGVFITERNMIYLMSKDYIQIFDRNLIRFGELRNAVPFTPYSSSNIVVSNSIIHYYNDQIGFLKLDTHSFTSNRQFPLDHYANNINRYIYSPVIHTEFMTRLDLELKTLYLISLKRVLAWNFKDSGICIVPTGEVFIINQEACFLMNPSTLTFTQLPNIPASRTVMNLAYHSGYIYLFGGTAYDYKRSDRFSLKNRAWSRIADTIQETRKASCAVLEDMIYIVRGNANAIEVYDTRMNSYRVINIALYDYSVAVGGNEGIYVINRMDFKVFSRELEVIREGTNKEFKHHTFTRGNGVMKDGVIYFVNDEVRAVEFCDVRDMRRGFESFKAIDL